VQAIRDGKGEVALLDPTMPDMDACQLLETIHNERLDTMVIIISGDIQPAARMRVSPLGALDFIQKPVSPEKLASVLSTYGSI
jgi:two-component system chemotaxis response regulator CheY